jgi:hypothetical protein
MNLYRVVIKFLNAVLGCSLLVVSANAQSVSSEVLAAAGNDMLTPNVTLSYTIGEVAVNYWNTGGSILTEGFQQNEVIITSISETAAAVNVNVFPNPFANSFNVDFNDHGDYALVVTDALGRTVQAEENLKGIDRYTVDMQNLAAGLYYLSLTNNHQPVAVYRLVKSTP